MNWFEDWFNSKYYHILYKSRDYEEASQFISNLNDHFAFRPSDHILDLACGKGRHSIQLSKFNCEVTGIDLSPESIEIARQSETDSLKFRVGDMRGELGGPYSHVLNLFTSFGYFMDSQENLKVFEAVKKSLNPNGTFLIDFFNAKCVEALVGDPFEKEIDGIKFKISKEIKDAIIHKTISFSDAGRDYKFVEHVQLLKLQDFEKFAGESGFELRNIWGDYALNPYSEGSSDRLIIEFRLQ